MFYLDKPSRAQIPVRFPESTNTTLYCPHRCTARRRIPCLALARSTSYWATSISRSRALRDHVQWVPGCWPLVVASNVCHWSCLSRFARYYRCGPLVRRPSYQFRPICGRAHSVPSSRRDIELLASLESNQMFDSLESSFSANSSIQPRKHARIENAFSLIRFRPKSGLRVQGNLDRQEDA